MQINPTYLGGVKCSDKDHSPLKQWCFPLPGKVYVSHIVDYLRHTTSRSSEDSGLEELCNMLDPEHKDVSIDLDTYHAVMREWIDDCRNNGYVRVYVGLSPKQAFIYKLYLFRL